MVSFLAPGRWVADPRGEGRAVRISAHTETGFLVLSTWKAGVCVGTVHLLPKEAADLIGALSEALALMAIDPLEAPALSEQVTQVGLGRVEESPPVGEDL